MCCSPHCFSVLLSLLLFCVAVVQMLSSVAVAELLSYVAAVESSICSVLLPLLSAMKFLHVAVVVELLCVAVVYLLLF